MDIPMDAKVFCKDGLCGRSTYVVLNPKTEEVTHLVVKQQGSPHQEILIPVHAVTTTTADSTNLGYTRQEMAKLQPFIETEYIKVDIPRPAGGIYFMTPYVYPEVETIRVKHRAIPADELAVRRGAAVEASDGHVGHVEKFLVDPENDHITHLILEEGHLWGQKDVTIPVSEIERIEEDHVYLKLDKHSIGELPSVPMRRK